MRPSTPETWTSDTNNSVAQRRWPRFKCGRGFAAARERQGHRQIRQLHGAGVGVRFKLGFQAIGGAIQWFESKVASALVQSELHGVHDFLSECGYETPMRSLLRL
jgi:hypothetical protein